MSLVIQIRDGQPYEHPIVADNFMSAFPHLDINNLPNTFAKFERIPRPIEGPYEEIVGLSYQWDGDVVKDTWEIRQFTEEEKLFKINLAKQKFAQAFPNVLSWTFDEERCGFACPVPYPITYTNDPNNTELQQREIYVWNESLQAWQHHTDFLLANGIDPQGQQTGVIAQLGLFIVGKDFFQFS